MLSRYEHISTFKVNGYPCKGNNSSIYFFAFLLSGDRLSKEQIRSFNPIALKTAKTQRSFGRSECNRVKVYRYNVNFFFPIFIKGSPVLFSRKTKSFQRGSTLQGKNLLLQEHIIFLRT